jgi:hypothetical protein
MKDNRRKEQRDYTMSRGEEDDARWLHGHHQGYNSDRGNYTVDTHFNRGYGRSEYEQYGDKSSYNTNEAYRRMSDDGRFTPGGALYGGQDFTRRGPEQNNPYGMTYIPSDNYNSGRHYDSRADYSDHNYDDLRNNQQVYRPDRLQDEGFGHDVRSGRDNSNWARGSQGDYESYRRDHKGERDNRQNFYGRNNSSDSSSFGGRGNAGDLDSWQGQGDQNYERYIRERDRR